MHVIREVDESWAKMVFNISHPYWMSHQARKSASQCFTLKSKGCLVAEVPLTWESSVFCFIQTITHPLIG